MIGTASTKLYVDNRNAEEKYRNSTPSEQYFSSYGIPSGNISIKTCPLGSVVALASINNLAISSAPNIYIPTNTSGAASLDIPLIAVSTVGSICFIAMLTYFGYRFRNISAREDSGGDDHNEPASQYVSHINLNEPAPRYVSLINLNEPAPLYVSHINLHDTS